jgi:hypothetical protein
MHAMLPQQTPLTLSCLCMQGGWRLAMAVHMAALLLLAPFTSACRTQGVVLPSAPAVSQLCAELRKQHPLLAAAEHCRTEGGAQASGWGNAKRLCS